MINWWINYLEHKQNKYQKQLNEIVQIIGKRAKELNYSYLGNMGEMHYLFDKKYDLLNKRNDCRSRAEKVKAKLKWGRLNGM